MDMVTVTAKTVEEAVTKALIELQTTSDKLTYEKLKKAAPDFLELVLNRQLSGLRGKRPSRIKPSNFSSRYLMR